MKESPDNQHEEADVVVVGAGPCGIAVGAAARRAGLRPILYDRGSVVESIRHYPPYMTFFSTANRLEIEGIPFTIPRDKPTRLDALVYYRNLVRYFQLPVRAYEDVEEIAGSEGDFRVRSVTRSGRRREQRARAVVVATGSFHAPNKLDVPGEDLPKVSHHYDEAHPYFHQDVMVVGGSNSAVEACLELYRAHARVTLVHFAADLDANVKPWLLPDIRNRLEEDGVTARWRTRVHEIRPESVVLRNEEDGTLEEVANDWVLALTGWRSDPQLLHQLGVTVDPETGVPAHDPGRMATDVPGVYIAGVLAAGNDANRIFIENGREHGRLIVADLQRGPVNGSSPAP